MAREHWDFNERKEEYWQFLRGLTPPVPPCTWKWTEDGRLLQVPAPFISRQTFTIRPVTPPDPPEWIRRLNEEANAPPPEWIRRLNVEARRDAHRAAMEAAEQDSANNDENETDEEGREQSDGP